MSKGGIFDAGFGEILRSPHLQWTGKCKFAPDPTLGYEKYNELEENATE